MNQSSIVQKLWNYCNVLRDDGMSYGDYVEAALAHLGNCSCVALPSAIHGGRSARGIRTSLFSTVDVSTVPEDGRRAHSATAPALPYLPPSMAGAGAVTPKKTPP